MKRVGLLQPTYLPYPGYFQIMDVVDEFYYMTDVQFSKPSWQMRNKIRTPFHHDKVHNENIGWMWLTVPTFHASIGTPERMLINTRIDNSKPWRQHHLTCISGFYAKSQWYEEYWLELENIYMKNWDLLVYLNIALIEWMKKRLGIDTPTFIEGELHYDRVKDKTQRLVNFCNAVGADLYLEPGGGAEFIDPKIFEVNGIELRFLHYEPPQYIQLYEDFVPYMSTLDMLFCLGPRAKNKLLIEWYDTEIREDHRDKKIDWTDIA